MDLAQKTEAIKTYISKNREDMLDSLRTCVGINSYWGNKAGANQVLDFFASLMEETGFKATRLDGGEYGDHLLLEHEAPGKARLLFVGHADTVFTPEEDWPFSVEEGKAYGPGVIDMKSGIITVLYALKALNALGEIPFAFKVLLNADEEWGSPNSRHYLVDLAKDTDFAFILEPAQPDGRLINTRKGVGKFDLYVEGRGAHAGKSPETGVNSVLELAHQIIKAESLANKAVLTTMNAGFIEGGQSAFIVAPSAHAEIESRVMSPEEQQRVEKGMADLTNTTHVPGAKVRVTGGFHRPPMVRLPGTEKLEDAILEAAKLLGLTIEFSLSGAASDGNNLSGLGVPVIDGMGPVGGREHSRDEYLELESLYERTELLAVSLLALAKE